MGDVERGDAEFAIRAQAGQAVRVHFLLSNYADRGGSQLQTGEIAFSMTPAVEGEAVIGREIQLQSVEVAWVQAVMANVYADQIRDEKLSITIGTSPKSIIVRGPAKLVTEVARLIARLDISVRVEPIDGEKDPGKASAPNGALSAWDDQAEFHAFDQDLTKLEAEADPPWDDYPESVPSDILRDAIESR